MKGFFMNKKLIYSLLLLIPLWVHPEPKAIERNDITVNNYSESAGSSSLVNVDKEPVKIGYFSFQKAADPSTGLQEFKDDKKNVQDQMEKKGRELQQLGQEYQKKRSDLQTMSSTLTPEAREQKVVEIANLENQLKIKDQAAQASIERANQEIQFKMAENVNKQAKEYAQKNGIDLILSEFGVLYASEKIDITESVVKPLNNTYKEKKKKEEAKKVMQNKSLPAPTTPAKK